MKQLAIIGPTASGKSDLAINIAKKIDAYILSIDSLSIYKEIDIVSAKPSKEELNEVRHFGINELYPDEYFSVEVFINLYKEVVQQCKEDSKNLIIVGGTSFYLKSLMQGLSQIPHITAEVEKTVQKKLQNLEEYYKTLYAIDPLYMDKITPNDRYRIEKAALIYEASQISPSEWFKQNPPQPIIKDIHIFNIDVARDVLRSRIEERTKKMDTMGLIDEVCYLEQKYSRTPNAMKTIGIKEVLEYLDGKVSHPEMLQNITTHTAQLAKRQQTFNKTQFDNVVSAPLQELEGTILKEIPNYT